MKKSLAALVALALAAGILTGCGNTAAPSAPESGAGPGSTAPADGPVLPDTGKLVVYSAGADDEIALYVPYFEEKYGIEVEVVSAGVGELLKRIEGEAASPLGDVLVGGTRISNESSAELFENYQSAEFENMLSNCRHEDGRLIDFTQCAVCMIVNDNLKGELQIEGFADLLQPELKGKIAFADPSASSNAYTHLVNMLYDMGEGDIWSDAAWGYVEKFCEQLDGKVLNSSSDTPRAVAEGEYTVGLTLETSVAKYMDQGYPVRPVYMKEGTFVSECVASIIKQAPNMKNAQLFMDYMLGEEFQTRYAEQNHARSIRQGIVAPAGMVDTSEINVLAEFTVTVDEKAKIISRFNDLLYS